MGATGERLAVTREQESGCMGSDSSDPKKDQGSGWAMVSIVHRSGSTTLDHIKAEEI